MRTILGELNAIPPLPAGYALTQLLHAPLYSSSVDLLALIQPDTCTSDSCLKSLRIYRWNVDRHAYELHDSLQSRQKLSLSSADLTGDGLDEILIRSADRRRAGLTVLGVTATSRVLVGRYQRDSIEPHVARLAQRSALVEFDSEYARILTGVAVNVPKKYFSVQGEFFLEAPNDADWAHYVERMRDSIHLVLSLTRDEMRSERRPDAGLQAAFVRASIGAALLDTSWYHGQHELSQALTEFTAKLTSGNYQALAKLSLTTRASQFVRQSASWNPQLLKVLGDLDDAIAIRDEGRCRAVAEYLLKNNPDPNALVRSANALVGNNLLLDEADRLLVSALAVNPSHVPALRARAIVFERRNELDSARALLIRSLQFDSTSSEAMRVRQELGY